MEIVRGIKLIGRSGWDPSPDAGDKCYVPGKWLSGFGFSNHDDICVYGNVFSHYKYGPPPEIMAAFYCIPVPDWEDWGEGWARFIRVKRALFTPRWAYRLLDDMAKKYPKDALQYAPHIISSKRLDAIAETEPYAALWLAKSFLTEKRRRWCYDVLGDRAYWRFPGCTA